MSKTVMDQMPKKKQATSSAQVTTLSGLRMKTTVPISIYAIPAMKVVPKAISRSNQVNCIILTVTLNISPPRSTV